MAFDVTGSASVDGTTIMTLHLLSSDLDCYEAAVDDVIASCDGDLRGALTTLIIANEFLERDLQEALSSNAAPSIAEMEVPGRRLTGCMLGSWLSPPPPER